MRKTKKENILATTHPELVSEWHPTKNGELQPTDVTFGSKKIVWWVCSNGHEWEARISNRTNKRRCPYCIGKRPTKETCLATVHPTIANEWHSTKNGDLQPTDVTFGSAKKVWWLCSNGHEWEASIVSRTNMKSGCPYCKRKKRANNNHLADLYPNLSNEWHPTKNGTLTLSDVTYGSGRKAWWICHKGHEWEATIVGRVKGTGCPFCLGRRVTKENCLATVRPELAREWHPTKNEELQPTDVTCGTKRKVWWQCTKGHEWETRIDSRTNGAGCPYCIGQLVTNETCLATVFPTLANEWHSTKNGSLQPTDITSKSGKKVWWQCTKGHEWEATVFNRANGANCPYCFGRYVTKENCLATVYPTITNEWHPIKNGELQPTDVTKGSNKKVWWKCHKGHEWEAIIYNRTAKGAGCPICTKEKRKKKESPLI